MEPNTREMSPEMAAQLQEGVVSAIANGHPVERQCDADSNSCTESSTMLDIPELHIMKNISTRRHQIVLPPEQLLFINLPTALPADAFALAQPSLSISTKDNNNNNNNTSTESAPPARARAPVYRLQWDDTQAFGGITMLDLSNHAMVHYMRSLSLPKAYFLYSNKDKKAYTRALAAILPLTRKYIDKLKVYFCPYETCAEYTHKFGLEKKNLPRSVVDDPANGMKFTNTEGYRSLTYTRIERFWKQALDEMDPPEGGEQEAPDL